MSKDILVQIEVLQSIEKIVERLMVEHKAKRTLWFSSDLMPVSGADESNRALKMLQERAKHIPQSALVSIALNMLTEEGLPHFHRLLAYAFGEDSTWAQWNFLWTAEEDRHGNVLRDYCRDSRIFDFNELEKYQFDFLLSGFSPSWGGDPYKTLVYTSAQERATQISHESTSRAVANIEPTITSVLKKMSVEEARHFYFYMSVFKEIMIRDTNRALQSAHNVLSRFNMPGSSIKNFSEIAEVVVKSGIYSLDDYKIILEQLISQWKVGALTGLNEIGRKAQEKIMMLPKRTAKLAEYFKERLKKKTFSFDFLLNRTFEF